MNVEDSIETRFQALTPRYPELKGQVAVVTGGAKGIGQGIALRLAREGMRVVIGDIDGDSLASTTAALEQLGTSILAVEGDLGRPAAIRRLFERAEATYGGIDLLVNNAADLERRRLLDEHEALLEQQLAVNVRAPYLCSSHAARIMRDAGGGNIIHISSVGGIRAHWLPFPYDVTKGAIDAMTRAMAIDLAEYNIRVNAVAPGATRTRRTPANAEPIVKEMAGRIPLGRFGQVSEISAVVAFLASPEASYMTGQIIYVDGGITAQLSPPGQRL
jgi:NAD(P)-dependent dehydrogenase (short-subunit alcohol dehydrogenase family)